MKRLIKSLIPPILLYPFRSRKKNEPTYRSYEEALSHCNNPAGYEEDDIVKVVLEKTKRFKAEVANGKAIDIDATTAFGMYALHRSFEQSTELTVLDFGGACGLHYFTFRNLLSNKFKLNWIVVETPNMVRFAKELETDELKFYDDLNLACQNSKTIDLVFSSGTIQSVSNPLQTIKELINVEARFFFLTRLSLNLGTNTVIAKQQTMLSENGLGSLPDYFNDRMVEYPHTNIPENRLLDSFNGHYRIINKLNETSGIHKVNDEPIIGYGMFLEKLI